MRGIIDAQNVAGRVEQHHSQRHLREVGTVVGSDYRTAPVRSPHPERPPTRNRPPRSVPPRHIPRRPHGSVTVPIRRTGDFGRKVISFPSPSLAVRRLGVRARRWLSLIYAPVLIAVPFALLLVAFLFNDVISARGIYAYGYGVTLPATYARSLVEASFGPDEESSDQPLSVDPSRFEQIRNTDYVVESGDTISEIAERFDLDPGTILSVNPISDVRRLLPGTTLSIPDRDGIIYAVQPGDSISSIADEFDISQAALLDANDIRSPVLQVNDTLFLPGVSMGQDQYLMAIGELFTWPLRPGTYRFTSGYGMRIHPIDGNWHMHTGVDLAASTGTPVLAARAGRVQYLERNSAQYGNFVIIDHGDGFQSLYAHLNTITVSVGNRVGTSQQIGTVGNTGRSTGPHLHFSIMRGGRTQDPLLQLP